MGGKDLPDWDLYYNRDGEKIPREVAWRLMGDPAYKRVAETTIEGRFWVSTVWLCFDHNFTDHGPPVIFETMVFPVEDEGPVLKEELWGYTSRYSTEAQAREGHGSTVLLIRYEIEYGGLRPTGASRGEDPATSPGWPESEG